MKLALLGVDPRTVFRTETFHGSHRRVIEALVEGACDVAGTYARADEDGKVTVGAWTEVEGAEVRVLATFGAIPPDVIAVRQGFPELERDKVLSAIQQACAAEPTRGVVRDIFGGDEILAGPAPGYDALTSALEMAAARELFD